LKSLLNFKRVHNGHQNISAIYVHRRWPKANTEKNKNAGKKEISKQGNKESDIR
jgi:hypothetical protein